MLIDVVKVIPRVDYRLDLFYANGEHRQFDMRPFLTLKPWDQIAAPEVFRLARAEYGTVVWPGEIDIAPETLYDDSVPV